MIVTEYVQHAVDDEQRQLVVEGAGVLAGLRRGDRRADDDVAEQHRHAGASRSVSSGNDSTSVGPS